MTERAVVVIPTYDERENLPRIVAAVLDAEPDVHVLVVDDASPDGTGQLADEIAAAEPRVKVMHRRGKEGLGRAYLDAFARVLADPIGYTHVIQIDADFSHDPQSIGALRRACREGADVAVGSRWTKGGGTRGWPRSRQLMSRGGSRYAGLVLGVPVRDLTAGFKCWRREVLQALPLDRILTAGYGFQIEMTTRAIKLGFDIVEVPIMFTDRTLGRSKMSGAIFREALVGVWKLRRALAHADAAHRRR